MIKSRLQLARRIIGPLGFAAIALGAAAIAFQAAVLAPLHEREAALRDRAARVAPTAPAAPRGSAPAAVTQADKVAAVYRYLERGEDTTDWLATLHAIGAASGVQMKSAAYRTLVTGTPIRRTEIVLPVAGTYPQIREFLRRAAAEIPLMSVDQVTLRREDPARGPLQAELRLTLHMVKS